MILITLKRAIFGTMIATVILSGQCLAQTNKAKQVIPPKKWPDVSGVVIDGKLDLSRPKLETFAGYLMAQQQAMMAGDTDRVQKMEQEAESNNLLNVVSPTRPIPYATVSLVALNPRAKRTRQWDTTADSDGKFEFFDVPNGDYKLIAKDTRQGTNNSPTAELTVVRYRTHDRVRITVYPQTITVTGRVTDSLGNPVTNVTIEARHGHESFEETEGDFTRAYHETTTTTDSDGRYELKELIPADLWAAGGLGGGGYGSAYAWYTLKLSAPGYLPAKAFVPVVDEETRQAAQTFHSLLLSKATPHEKASRYTTKPVEQPPCQGYTLSKVDFELAKPVRVEGVFVNKDGVPQAGRRVDLWPTNDARWSSSQAFPENPRWASSDHEGKFRFDSVAPGTYRVSVYEGNRLVSGYSQRLIIVREGEPVTGLRLVNDAPPRGKIAGVVTDAETGKPIKGVTMYAIHNGSWTSIPVACLCGTNDYHTSDCAQTNVPASQTNSPPFSTFAYGMLTSGTNELAVKAPGYTEEHVVVTVTRGETTTQDVKLWRARTVRIRPVIKKGARVDYYASLPGTPPLVRYAAIPKAGCFSVKGGNHIVSAGYDELTGLKPELYTLRGDIRYLPSDVQRFETVPLEVSEIQTNEVELAFTGKCGIQLDITFAPGTAVQMTLETADTPPLQETENNIGLRATAFFREPGSYLVPDLKAGRYRLSLFRRKVPAGRGSEKQEGPTQVTEVILIEGAALQTLKFEL